MSTLEDTGWIVPLGTGQPAQRRLAPGDALFRQGDPASALYQVLSGQVRLVRHLEDGSSVTLHVARAGETFAEAALFAEAYHCDAVAATPAQVAVVPKAELAELLRKDPDRCLAFARALAVQVRDLRARLELRNIRSASDRVLGWLRLQARGEPPMVVLDRSWTAIATEIGLTREALYRTLAQLDRAGRIERQRDRITLRPHGD